MYARKLIAAILASGPLLGVFAGLAVDPQMQPPPEPSWRQLRPDPIFTEQPPAEPSAPGPAWTLDRLPTWKRRALAEQSVLLPRTLEPTAEPTAPPAEAEPAGQTAATGPTPAAPDATPDQAPQADAGGAPAIVLPARTGAWAFRPDM